MVYKKFYKKGNKNVPSKKFSSMVKKVIEKKAEHKYNEANVVSLNFDATPAGATLVKNLEVDITGNIAQGTGARQRIGDRIRVHSLDFRAVFVPTTATSGAVRILIGQCIDQETHASMTLTYGDVLSQLSGAGDYSCITSAYDHEPLVKYKLLCDEVITWDATNAAAPRVIAKHFNNLGVRNRNFDGSSNISTGTFWYMLLSANSVAATLKYPYAKVTYTDY